MKEPPASASPPRAFTQGVGAVFQFVGVTLFLATMGVCCVSSFFGKQAIRHDLTGVGWHWAGDAAGRPSYSVPVAMTLSVALASLLGVALAGIGLGLQAQRPESPWAAVGTTLLGTVFWTMQTAFAVRPLGSMTLTILGALLAIVFALLLGFSIVSLREMWRNPPPIDQAVLPVDYQIPYSHLHQDSPEVRFERELAQRRQKLAVDQKELDALEQKIRRWSDEKEK